MSKFNRPTARSAEHYEKVWNAHIDELTSVLYESSIPQSEWDLILQPLRNAVKTAASKLEVA